MMLANMSPINYEKFSKKNQLPVGQGPVYTPEQITIRDARKQLNFSQQSLSELIRTHLLLPYRHWNTSDVRSPPGVMTKT